MSPKTFLSDEMSVLLFLKFLASLMKLRFSRSVFRFLNVLTLWAERFPLIFFTEILLNFIIRDIIWMHELFRFIVYFDGLFFNQ